MSDMMSLAGSLTHAAGDLRARRQTCAENRNLLIERWTLKGADSSEGLSEATGLSVLLLVLEGGLELLDRRTEQSVRMTAGDFIVIDGTATVRVVDVDATLIRCVFQGDVGQERFPETRRDEAALAVSNVFADRPRIVTICENRNVRFDVVTSYGHASPGGHECESASHEWLLMLKGDTVFTIEGVEHPLSAGDDIYLPPRVPNGVRNTNVKSGTVWLAVFYRGAIGAFDWESRAAKASVAVPPAAEGQKKSAAAQRLDAFKKLRG